MAHDVKLSMPKRSVGKTDFNFEVWIERRKRRSNRTQKAKFGTLKISKGSLVWIPAGSTTLHDVSWERFARFAVKKR